jgi:hypothetical protein
MSASQVERPLAVLSQAVVLRIVGAEMFSANWEMVRESIEIARHK